VWSKVKGLPSASKAALGLAAFLEGDAWSATPAAILLAAQNSRQQGWCWAVRAFWRRAEAAASSPG